MSDAPTEEETIDMGCQRVSEEKSDLNRLLRMIKKRNCHLGGRKNMKNSFCFIIIRRVYFLISMAE